MIQVRGLPGIIRLGKCEKSQSALHLAGLLGEGDRPVSVYVSGSTS